MKLANKAFVIALTMLALIISTSAQTIRSNQDDRNQAPTVGTGGPPGGPTGLFTIYDGQTLRRGEFTFSAAYSNYDRDPGNVDIVEIPLSFQVGVSDHLELFFNTDAYRAIKVNSPRNLSSFYLPNSQLRTNNVLGVPPAIVLGQGAFAGRPVFRLSQQFGQFPFIGGRTFPFAPGGSVIGVPFGGGNGAANFPGLGSVFGSILPGVVLQTANITSGTTVITVPTVFTLAPSYLPDAPFINRQYGESAFNTFTVGGKIRFTGPNNPIGVGLIPFYRFYADDADDFSGFNQLQRGASPGGGGPNPFSDSGRGDFGLVAFADARLRKWLNISANLGYIYNSSVKSNDVVLLDRPDEVIAGIGLDFPVNKYFQPILEGRSTQYVGGRTPNAFENSPIEGLAGARVYPTRYISLGGAYRYHFNQQDRDSFNDNRFTGSTSVPGGPTLTSNFTGVPPGFQTSSDPHGFIFQITAGRRNSRQPPRPINQFADVTNVELSETRVTTPCPPGFRPAEGADCSADMSVNISTTAVDPEGDVLTYNYTVSGGRIVGQGANVSWDLTGISPGTYTVTAGVDDGCGICGKTVTKTIVVEACNCVAECVCPTLSVTGPSDVTMAGATMTFTANASGGSSSDFTYNWTVSQGEIISGQGTPVITVQTTPEMQGQNVTATVTLGGDCSCDRSDSETAAIAPTRAPDTVDQFGPLPNDEVKARVDNFYISLNNNPDAQGYIINYGTDRQIAARERQIRDAIRVGRYDPSRVTFVRGGDRGNGIETVFYLVPAGVEPPTPQP